MWEAVSAARSGAVREAVWLWLASDMMLVTGIGNPSGHLLDEHLHKALQCSGLISLNGVYGPGLLSVQEGGGVEDWRSGVKFWMKSQRSVLRGLPVCHVSH